MNNRLLGGVEAGGTKFICAVGTTTGEIVDKVRIATTNPVETINNCRDFFKKYKKIKALGIGCFGPLDLKLSSSTYGYITSTPKPGWQNTNIVGAFREALQIPVNIDTDVNGAALAEFHLGAGKDCSSIMYLTVGTGIGGGIVIDGKPLHGLVHPEMGHVIVRRHKNDDYIGGCPFHRDCFEGLANGLSIRERWGRDISELGNNNDVLDIISYYIAQSLVNYLLTFSPEKIIIGGGVLDQQKLMPLILEQFKDILAGYVKSNSLDANLSTYIVPPSTGGNAGILGALLLANECVSIS